MFAAGTIALAAAATGVVLMGASALALTQGGSCNAFRGAVALGASYSDSALTVPTCGPRPGYAGGPAVKPYPGAPRSTPGYQCVEFSERFIYYKYGLGAPNLYTDGDMIVDHYASAYPSKFTVETASSKVPLVQGDVISFASNSTFNGSNGGHTAVVQASDINSSGTGNVTIVEENASPTGQKVLQVKNWAIQGSGWNYIKWLHYTATALPPGGTGSGPGSGSGSGKKVDLVFAIDTTGSMAPYIDSVVAASSSIVNALTSAHADFQVGVVDYKDSDYGCSDYDAVTDLSFSTDPSAIQSALSSLKGKVEGGCDIPEDVYSGIDRALHFPWRSGVTKTVIVMGDAPGHDPEPHTGLTLAKIQAEAYAVDPAQVDAVLVGSDPDAHSFDQALADATSGKTFDATSDPSAAGPAFVTAINAIVGGTQPTTTTVSLEKAQVAAGQPVQLKAEVSPTPSSGTVTFTANGVPIEQCQGAPVTSGGTASCTTSFETGGTASIGAIYSGDDSYADSTATPVSLSVTGSCRTGVVNRWVTIPAGASDCFGPGSVINGGVIVGKGASLFLIGSVVRGYILALAPDHILACANHIHGLVSVAHATGLVTIGDLDGSLSCAGNIITGVVLLQHNTDGVEISDNTVYGGIKVVGTTGTLPPPDTGALDMQNNVTAKRIARRDL